MALILANGIRRPYMLSDLIKSAQQLSASLPPDDWEPDSERPLLAQKPSGKIELVSRMRLWGDGDARLIRDKPAGKVKHLLARLCRCFGGSKRER